MIAHLVSVTPLDSLAGGGRMESGNWIFNNLFSLDMMIWSVLITSFTWADLNQYHKIAPFLV